MKDLRNYKTPQDVKTEYAAFRITHNDKVLLSKAAQRCGISMSAFLRLLIQNWYSELFYKNPEK